MGNDTNTGESETDMQVTDDRVSGSKRPPKSPPSTEAPDPRENGASSLIDENLRRVYDDLVEDEMPDRFRALLEQLRNQEGDQ